MTSLLIVIVIIAAGVGLGLAIEWHVRRTRLSRLRREWTRPRERLRMMALIAEYHRLRVSEQPGAAWLDDRAWDDLLLDDVFGLLDRTESTVGQQVLYHRLRSLPTASDVEVFEAFVAHMSADPAARERTQTALARLQHPAGYHLCSLERETFEAQPWHVLFPVLAASMLIAVLLIPFAPVALLIVISGAMVHLLVRYLIAGRIGAAIGVFRQIGPLISAAEVTAALRCHGAESKLDPLRKELPRLNRLKLFARWAGRDPAGGELLASFFEYLNLFFLLDANALYFGAQEVRRHAGPMMRVLATVGEVDAAVAVASFRSSIGQWTRPRLGPSVTPATLTDLRHPLLTEPVPNSIVLAPPFGVLLSGANMSGKSTFLRTVGVNVVLAQTINTCLATRYEAPVFRVLSLMGRADDLLAGKSYYLVEVEAIVRMVQSSSSEAAHLFLFDELFRGTNTVERVAAASAVLTHLVGSGRSRGPHVVLAATHDRELVQLLRHTTSYHLSDALGDQELVFEYRLRPGPATSRNAIALLRLHGAPDTLVRDAQSLADAFDAVPVLGEAACLTKTTGRPD
ncbi:MAG TPA: hypothetical protein VES67_10620 [Vicinamibacterales bacterium]|nr:hypothetical protein [Vicinamibacterales bacterium]